MAAEKVRGPKQLRAGAVTVEFALTAPILFMLVMGAIEFSRMNQLIHTTTIAAAEGAREGIIPGATAGDVQKAALHEMDILGVKGSTVEVFPAVITDDTQNVTVTVDVPLAKNGYILPRFFLGKTVSKEITLQRETADERRKTKDLKPKKEKKEKKEKAEKEKKKDDDDDDD